MKEKALSLARQQNDPARKLNILREYVQACLLRSLHESEAFLCVSFVGGTALRFLFNLPRFSEDLDFSLETPAGYAPVRWMEKAKRDLTASGFDVSVQWNDRKTVHVAWFRFAKLLHEAGLAGTTAQKLSVKVEVDTRPPTGAVAVNDLVNRHMIFAVRHHDLPSLMAGKVHALMVRRYPKGRDWYDLMWYGAQRPLPEPRKELLQNALNQTEGVGACDAATWRNAVLKKLRSIDLTVLRSDVAPFLERADDAALLTEAHIRAVLTRV